MTALISRDALVRAHLSDSTMAGINLAGVSGRRLVRLLHSSGVLEVGATSTSIRPEFVSLAVHDTGDVTATFSAWVYHGRVEQLT